ncbi:MAG: hypothetical protein DRN61_05915 [Thaumarchaeota archaeon]|nr:MAG: hypothetical protein DRN61_05915 [Nitrososphaerota archaeon]
MLFLGLFLWFGGWAFKGCFIGDPHAAKKLSSGQEWFRSGCRFPLRVIEKPGMDEVVVKHYGLKLWTHASIFYPSLELGKAILAAGDR